MSQWGHRQGYLHNTITIMHSSNSLILPVADDGLQTGVNFKETRQTLAGCPLDLGVILVLLEHTLNHLEPFVWGGLHLVEVAVREGKRVVHCVED